MTYRVVQWGTGWAGRQALQAIIDHPDLELAGLVVNSREKEGADAGDLVGRERVGVAAIRDVDEALAIGADCHTYMLLGHTPETRNTSVRDLVEILRAGQNVCQMSLIEMLYTKYAPKDLVDTLMTAALEGRASCYSGGIIPGIMLDVTPLALVAGSERVDHIRITELGNWLEYYSPESARAAGVGGPVPSEERRLQMRDAYAASAPQHPAIRHLAERLGVELDNVRTGRFELAPAVERVDSHGLVIEPGTLGARWHTLEGCVGDRPVIELGWLTRYDNAAAPDWPRPQDGVTGCFRYEIEGSPRIWCDLNLMGRRDTPSQTAGFATESNQLGLYIIQAQSCINAVPFTVQAAPGLYGSPDIDRTKNLRLVYGSARS